MRLPFATWTRRERMLLAVCGTSLALSTTALLGLGGKPGLDTDSSAPAWYQNDRWTFSGNDYGGASNMVAFAICMKN